MDGITTWALLQGIRNRAATVARVLLPVALVFYAAFDSLVGIGAGLLSREAAALADAGADTLASRWMEIPMPIPIISTVATVSWSLALLAAAVARWRTGSSWIAVGGLALAGPLFGFGHPLVLGLVGMAGLLVAVVVLEWLPRDRRGWLWSCPRRCGRPERAAEPDACPHRGAGASSRQPRAPRYRPAPVC